MKYSILALVSLLGSSIGFSPIPTEAASAPHSNLTNVVRLGQSIRVANGVPIDPFQYGVKSPCVQVGGVGPIPGNAEGVFITVSAAASEARHTDLNAGVFASGQQFRGPWALVIRNNQQTSAASTVVRLGHDGKVCVEANNGRLRVTLDVTGYVTPGGPLVIFQHPWNSLVNAPMGCYPIAGDRELDDYGHEVPNGLVIPRNATELVAVVTTRTPTAIDGGTTGHVSVFAGGTRDLDHSRAPFEAGMYLPTTVATPVGANGKVCFEAVSGATTINVKVIGYSV